MRQRLIEKAIRGQLVPQSDSEPEVEQIGETPEDEPFEIPEKWKWVQLRELVTYAKQKVPDRDFLYIDVSSIHKFSVLSPKRLSVSNAPSRARKIVQSGSVLFSTVRPYLMNVCVIDNVAEETIASTAFATMLCNKSINNKYLFYVLTSPFFTEYVKSVQRGVSYPAISDKDLQKSLIPLPPYNEQLRIVTKVEHLLVQTDKAEKAYNTLTGPLSEQYKALILDKAMRGQLVPQLDSEPEVEQIGEVSEDVPLEIPAKWKWVKLENLSREMADGPFGSNLKKEHYTNKHEVRIIQLSNIGEHGWRDENVKYTTHTHAETIPRSRVNSGDIVIAKMMPAGRAVIVPDSDASYVLCSDAVKVVVKTELILTKFLNFAINSQIFKQQVYANVQGTTRVRTSLSKLKTYQIPVPPLEEQSRIVAKIEALFSQVEKISV